MHPPQRAKTGDVTHFCKLEVMEYASWIFHSRKGRPLVKRTAPVAGLRLLQEHDISHLFDLPQITSKGSVAPLGSDLDAASQQPSTDRRRIAPSSHSPNRELVVRIVPTIRNFFPGRRE